MISKKLTEDFKAMDEIHQLKLIDKMGFLMAKRFPTRKAMGKGLI